MKPPPDWSKGWSPDIPVAEKEGRTIGRKTLQRVFVPSQVLVYRSPSVTSIDRGCVRSTSVCVSLGVVCPTAQKIREEGSSVYDFSI